MKLTAEQITKLKVSEIREELKLRGLDQTGTKALLISRLKESVEKEKAENEQPALTGSEMASVENGDSVSKEPKTQKSQEKPPGEEEGEIKPKHTPIVYTLGQKDIDPKKADEEAKKRRAARFGITNQTQDGAKKQKITRGGQYHVKMPQTEQLKMEQRAKRFASLSKAAGADRIDLSHIATTSTTTEEEKKRKRAMRFGTLKN